MNRLEILTLFILLHTALFTALYALFTVTHIFAVVTLCLLSGGLAAVAVACVAALIVPPPESMFRHPKS